MAPFRVFSLLVDGSEVKKCEKWKICRLQSVPLVRYVAVILLKQFAIITNQCSISEDKIPQYWNIAYMCSINIVKRYAEMIVSYVCSTVGRFFQEN